MLAKLARLFQRTQSPRVSMDHPDLGRLLFDPKANEWETAEGAPVYHGGLFGDQSGPDPKAIADILEKLKNIERYWQICSDDLLSIS